MRPNRRRWLMIAVAFLAVLTTTLLAGPTVRSALAASSRVPDYLALGDSVAFGFSPLVVAPSNPHHFSGYPTPAARALEESLTNAACPGETSSHFISLAGSDNGCGAFRAQFPLHVAYSGTQLEFVDSFLKSHPDTQLVSINIGANDLFVLQGRCNNNVDCILAGLPGMLATLSTNLNTIYEHIRNDGYQNKLVALTYYSPDYSDLLVTGVISQVNQVIAQVTLAWGGIVADGFDAFQAASAAFGGKPCAAGLLILKSSSTQNCDFHPSYPGDEGFELHSDTGRDVLGQAIVNALRTD